MIKVPDDVGHRKFIINARLELADLAGWASRTIVTRSATGDRVAHAG